MKSFMLAALVVLAVLRPAESGLLPSDAPGNGTLNLNSIFDGVVEKLRNRLSDLEPLTLPDDSILNELVVAGSTAQVDMKNGQLKNLKNMNRGGNVCLEINDTIYTVKANINFSGLEIDYVAMTKFPFIPVAAPVRATVKDFVVVVKVKADYSKMKLEMETLYAKYSSDASIVMWNLDSLGQDATTVLNMVVDFINENVQKIIVRKVGDEVKKMVGSLDLETLSG